MELVRSVVDGMMVSPPVSEHLDVPQNQFDEWCLFPDASSRIREFERFVNYGGFTLADPRSVTASFDASWERDALDWLYPVQERFWSQIETLRPISYIATGDNDVLVTRNPSFRAVLAEAFKDQQQ